MIDLMIVSTCLISNQFPPKLFSTCLNCHSLMLSLLNSKWLNISNVLVFLANGYCQCQKFYRYGRLRKKKWLAGPYQLSRGLLQCRGGGELQLTCDMRSKQEADHYYLRPRPRFEANLHLSLLHSPRACCPVAGQLSSAALTLSPKLDMSPFQHSTFLIA